MFDSAREGGADLSAFSIAPSDVGDDSAREGGADLSFRKVRQSMPTTDSAREGGADLSLVSLFSDNLRGSDSAREGGTDLSTIIVRRITTPATTPPARAGRI